MFKSALAIEFAACKPASCGSTSKVPHKARALPLEPQLAPEISSQACPVSAPLTPRRIFPRSTQVSGHGFIRAVQRQKIPGFSPWNSIHTKKNLSPVHTSVRARIYPCRTGL